MSAPLVTKQQALRMADTLDNLPRILAAARKARGLTYRQAAEQIGSTPSHLCNIEHGHAGLGSDLGARILRWLAGTHFGRNQQVASDGP